MDEQGTVKKIKDVNFDPLPTASTYDVKIDQSPSRSSITHDEFAKMIHKFFKISVIDKFNKFMDRYKKKEEKKSEFFYFFS
jgi:hypothetical protein